jgi:hypothetical protein
VVIEVSYTGQFLKHLRSELNLPARVVHFAQSGGILVQLEDVLNLVIEYCDEEITPDMKEIVDPGGIYRLDRLPKVEMILRGEVCE